jgi:BirA family biotin operon repressor/biotin-[acetyl-CoA-carboxylase] ligase
VSVAAQDLEEALARTRHRRGVFGQPLHAFDEVGSTNDEAARLAERGAPHGTTVVAASQSAGRGRLGRSWFSPPDSGLYASVIIRDARVAPLLTLAAGVALADAIRAATALPVEIKWPNDLVVESGLGRRRKLGGILTEGSSGAEGLQYIVLGFGINLLPTAFPPGIAERATSLAAELGRPVDSAVLFAECLAAIAERVAQLSKGSGRIVLDRWRDLSPSSSGARVECESADGTIRGVTAGIADDGALLVRAGSRVEVVRSGQVTWL